MPTATPGDASAVIEDRLVRGSSFEAGDIVTRGSESVSRPRFDFAAGVFGDGGIQPVLAPPQTLAGTSGTPDGKNPFGHSASVAVANSPNGAAGAVDTGWSGNLGAGDATPNAPGGSFASGFLSDPGWGSVPIAHDASAKSHADATPRQSAIVRSSVFVTNSGAPAMVIPQPDVSAASPAPGTTSGPTSGPALATVQGASSITVRQAMRDPVKDPAASIPAHPTIEGYTVSSPANRTASLTLPMKVSSSNYGMLNSSLTVFSDDFGAFGAAGQSFNGLAALNVAEPPAFLLVLLGLGWLSIYRCAGFSRIAGASYGLLRCLMARGLAPHKAGGSSGNVT